MGYGGTIVCKNVDCGYRKTYYLGRGEMPIYPLSSLITKLHPKTRPIIEEAVKDRHVQNYEHNRSLFHCTDCDHVFKRVTVKIEFHDGGSFETHKRCSRCKKDRTKEIDVGELENRICPKCKESLLKMDSFILWD
ncbi:hypothetical protein JSY36_03505 [Bacillus sp. H-16]|uniref:hypothetical protein n=1 Tax=Alteribacter salitolerans TaxID=2912333 RepID=UPI001965B3D8|nr:hypothetical protein [Alteribacter salitolerans]MBM7094813.1 hypothetical protein [Alteribacter salitolerans]